MKIFWQSKRLKCSLNFITIIFILHSCSINSSAKLGNRDYYKAAYNNICFDHQDNIPFIFDSIIFIPRTLFYSIFQKKNEDINDAINRLELMDSVEFYKPFYFNFKNIEKVNSNATKVLFFSKIYNNKYLLAEVLNLKKDVKLTYKSLTSFNDGIQYYFEMDSQGHIVRSEKAKIFYD